MCQLNKLKKKLQLKKLIDFLNLYKYVVFYHSNKGKFGLDFTLLKDNKSNQKEVLFLVNSARLRRLGIGSSDGHPLGYPLGYRLNPKLKTDKFNLQSRQTDKQLFTTTDKTVAASKAKCLERNKSQEVQLKKLLRLVTRGGAMGSTFLVGCNSLEGMQNCITKCYKLSPLDCVCLGGIYDNLYIDKVDCLRLAQTNTHKVSEQLINTLNKAGNSLLEQLKAPLFSLHLCLSIKSRNK